MFRFITGLVQRSGYAGIALLTLLENVFPPIPSELIMPLAGFVARRGTLSLWLAIGAGTFGSLLGALGWYAVGRRIGEPRARVWFERHGKWLGTTPEDIDRASEWFRRHGRVAVLAGRLVPAVRTFISLPAGFAGMPLPAFLLYTAIGTAVWTGALTWAGYLLGSNYGAVQRYLEPATWLVVGVLVLVPVVRVERRRRAGK